MRLTTFDVSALVHEVVADLGQDVVEVQAPTPILVVGDRDRTQQMLGNYLTNALRYGAAPITVHAVADDGFGKVTVSDEGEGVDEALRPKLFGKFSSGGAVDATGLGLFIVRELARAQSGDAWYTRSDDVTSFGFSLPLASSHR